MIVWLILLVALGCTTFAIASAGPNLAPSNELPAGRGHRQAATPCLDPTTAQPHERKDSSGRRTPRSAKGGENGTITVSTKNGLFRGLILAKSTESWRWPSSHSDRDEAVAAFLGVRYASAPLRRLRFMPPAPYKYAANQLHEATKFGPICMQRWPIELDNKPPAESSRHIVAADGQSANSSSRPEETKLGLLAKTMSSSLFHHLRPLFNRLLASEQSEDCLNLNIYVPLRGLREQVAELPVLVIIHGESFDYGAGSAYDGHKLLLHGAQMLVVTFNYRLNLFGFLPKLSGASRGNLGLMDQIAALHWIKDNIGSFGGSAGNVTLMGAKRGALFVNLLMLSPMAKGLFHRAIMEDGSALSPIVANQVAPPHQNPNSVQHLRMLAKLCDCPGPQWSRATHDAGPASSLPTEEAKANAQLLDCLRYKPLDQVTQRVPLDILQLDPTSGELTIQPRWQTKVRPLLAPGTNLAELSVRTEHLAQIGGQLIGWELAGDSPTPSDLFGAFYGHQMSGWSTVRPLFGPLVDGSIVPEEDFAANMLKGDSNLAHRDLLIGLTHPVLIGNHRKDDDDSDDEDSNHNRIATSSMLMGELGPDNYLSDRVSASQELQGLANEQAIGLVNAFVRSFYRYHNQEIANSILNHYLASNVWHKQVSMMTNRSTWMGRAEPSAAELQRQRQEFLLGSISRLFQDSLTDVPLLKLALIHSIKQMDSLLSAFVDRLFDQWRGSQADQRHLADDQDSLAAPAEPEARNSLLAEFTTFARQHSDWWEKSEWRQLPAGSQSSAKPTTRSTYLYQIGGASSNFGESMVAIIERIMSREKATEQANIWKLIGPILAALAKKLKSSEPFRRVSLECAHYPALNRNDDDIETRLEDWLCSRPFERILAGFVAAGDVNHLAHEDPNSPATAEALEASLASVESKCFSAPSHSLDNQHHSLVQPSMDDGDTVSDRQSRCRRHLENIALTVLTNEFKSGETRRWTNFNLFSQQIATLTHQDPAKLWTMNGISEFSNEPTGLVSKSSFWSNFIPALNCNKTQPITPAALLDGSGSNSSLINLSLQFTCQHGPKSAQDHLEWIVGQAGQRLRARKSQWRQSRAQSVSSTSSSSPSSQNHHSLRMANMSQSNSADDSLDPNDEHSNPSLSSLNETNELGTTSNAHTRPGADDFRANNKATGFVLVLCALIVGVSSIAGVYLAVKRRRVQEIGKQVSSDSKLTRHELEPEVSGQPTSTDYTQQSTSSFQPGAQSAGGQQAAAASVVEMISCLGDHSNGLAASEWQPDCPPGGGSAEIHSCLRRDRTAGGSIGQQQFQFEYEPGPNNQPSFGAGGCRSHSAMSLAPQFSSTSGFLNADERGLAQMDQAFDGHALGAIYMQEPIVLPILSNTNYQQHELRCHTLDPRRQVNFPASLADQSSTETQNGRSSQSSSVAGREQPTKKRVKINEPQSIMKCNNSNGRTRQADGSDLDRANRQQYRARSRVQLCPLHSRSQSSQYLGTADTGYILDGSSEYLTIDNPQAWTSEQSSRQDQFEQLQMGL